jgi:hypothetical protein
MARLGVRRGFPVPARRLRGQWCRDQLTWPGQTPEPAVLSQLARTAHARHHYAIFGREDVGSGSGLALLPWFCGGSGVRSVARPGHPTPPRRGPAPCGRSPTRRIHPRNRQPMEHQRQKCSRGRRARIRTTDRKRGQPGPPCGGGGDTARGDTADARSDAAPASRMGRVRPLRAMKGDPAARRRRPESRTTACRSVSRSFRKVFTHRRPMRRAGRSARERLSHLSTATQSNIRQGVGFRMRPFPSRHVP